MTTSSIKNIGIVGAGPGGLASLYELIHTGKDGSSTVGSDTITDLFNVTVFEQKDKAGGIWAPSEESDPHGPPQDILDTEIYDRPEVIHPSKPIPLELSNSSFKKPFTQETNKDANELEWKRSGVYQHLYTNIPSRFTRFSYMDNEPEYLDKKRNIYPFLTQGELVNRFDNFVAKNDLNKYIRFNSRVEDVRKNPETDKWTITIKQTNGDSESWYQQEFDAVVIANGHYTTPNFPQIDGLSEYNKKYPGKILHAKSYRDPKVFENRKVLVVGGAISTANLVQYVKPLAKETIISRRGPHLVYPWIDKALESDGFTAKPTISKIVGDEFIFSDGTKESDIDLILFTTGYHFHYPFLKDGQLKVVDPSNLSRVNGLYQHTFSIDDPTLAITGVVVSGINFHSIEASAAAIAGVWSGRKKLPSKEDQRKWSQARVDEVGNNLFYHYYKHTIIKEEFIDPIFAYAAEGRYNPASEDFNYVQEIEDGIDYLEKLFYKVKNGELTIEQTTKP